MDYMASALPEILSGDRIIDARRQALAEGARYSRLIEWSGVGDSQWYRDFRRVSKKNIAEVEQLRTQRWYRHLFVRG
jgi:hypothetical protein